MARVARGWGVGATTLAGMPWPSDIEPDDELFAIIDRELERENTTLQLIASENFASPAVLRATGSVLTNKYSEGYPGKRYYGGNQFIDEAEELARTRAKELFGAEHANVQPHSGANANMAVYLALLEPGDTVMGLSLDHGGHLTHGSPVNASGKLYNFVRYTLSKSDERLDMDAVREAAIEHRPKMIVAGYTAYPRRIDPEPFRAICDEVGRLFMFDAAHIAGLIAGGVHPNPVPYADVVTLTTHKTLRGPRGGCILSTAELAGGHRQGGVPRPAGRPAGARHRGEGGGVPRGDAPELRRLRGPDRGQRPGAGRGPGRRGLPAGLGRHRQPPDARRPAHLRRRAHRQAGPERARPGRHHRSTSTPSPTTPAPRSRPAACASARPPSPPRACGSRRWRSSPPSSGGRCATATTPAETEVLRKEVVELCGRFTPYPAGATASTAAEADADGRHHGVRGRRRGGRRRHARDHADGASARPAARVGRASPTSGGSTPGRRPTLGGLAMFLGFLAAMGVAWRMDVFSSLFADNSEPLGVVVAAVDHLPRRRDRRPPRAVARRPRSPAWWWPGSCSPTSA